MKLRRVRIENVRSFLDPAELLTDGDISIVIGPNGGGKTNLLDITSTALRRFILTSWVAVKSPTEELPDRYELRVNDAFGSLERHSRGVGKPQSIEVDLEVTSRDIENARAMHDSAVEFTKQIGGRYVGASVQDAATWDISKLSKGQKFTYRIVNNNLVEPQEQAAALFRKFLGLFEVDLTFRDDLGLSRLSNPMISMPVNRAADAFQSSVSLAGYNEYDFKRTVDAATSRARGSISTLAVGRLARRYRLLLEKDTGKAREEFYADDQIKLLSSTLASLGYRCELECVDALTNSYTLRITKQGTSFLVAAASSGEKELLTYLFAIYGLNVRDALITIDEPELHLHPQWQRTLLGLFEKLAKDTGNQFILATHSPVFVSPASIQYVSRVYSKDQRSDIIRLKNNALPEAKHLFSSVNTQNNERMFFADKVILVEGISDRLFFDAALKALGVNTGTTRICEIINVGGKNFFEPYKKLLIACQVPYAIIADLDYINEVGTEDIKKLFTIDTKAIAEKVIDDPLSKDGDALVSRIGETIESGNKADLISLWEYIKGRRRRLRSDLNQVEEAQLEAFIQSMRNRSIFILAKGDLETYLPEGYRSKELDKLIRLVSEDFWPRLPEFAKKELTVIAQGIEALH